MYKLEKMKDSYRDLKTRVKKINNQRSLSAIEYMNLRKLKQLKLWYKDRIDEIKRRKAGV